jgi:hypothetical protein
MLLRILEGTIARKVLHRPQGIKGGIHNLLNKGLFIIMITLCQPGRDVRRYYLF